MNGKVSRIDKINGELQKEVYDVISRRLHHPDVTAMVSVIKVDCSKDLAHAKVFLSVYSPDKEKCNKTFEAIKGSAKKIRYELAHSIKMRTVPELHFILDGTLEYGDKMDKLFHSISKEEK